MAEMSKIYYLCRNSGAFVVNGEIEENSDICFIFSKKETLKQHRSIKFYKQMFKESQIRNNLS